MMAAYHGRLDHVQYLLDNGARIDLKDEDGDTALNFAIEEKHVQIADFLRSKLEVK